jgi:hypothetical protein
MLRHCCLPPPIAPPRLSSAGASPQTHPGPSESNCCTLLLDFLPFNRWYIMKIHAY